MPRFIPPSRSAVRGIVCAVAAALLGAIDPVALGHGCPCGTVADEFRTADAGLVREWIVQVPFDSASWRLADVAVGDGLVVARASDGSVHAIHAVGSGTGAPRAGTVAWSRALGGAAGHSWPPTIGTRLVVVSSETAIHALDRGSGALEWERTTAALTAAGAMQSGGWVYAPLVANRILRLPVNPLGRPEAEPAAEAPDAKRRGAKAEARPTPSESLEPVTIEAGGDLDAAPLPLPTGVLWTTSNGLAALERTPLGWIRHQLPESAPPSWVRPASVGFAGPPVIRDGAIYVSTANGGLARVDLNAKNRPGLSSAWVAQLPDAVDSGPLVSGTTVLVSLGPAGIVAFAAGDGRELWRTDLVGTLVAAGGGRAWLLDTVGRLTALDLATGSRRQSLCLGCFTVPVVNTLTDRLVLASPGGLVVSLAPPPPPRPVSAAARPAAAPAPADPGATPR